MSDEYETEMEHIARDIRDGRFPSRSPRQLSGEVPRVLGVSREPGNPQAVLVSFAAPLSDDQLRSFHDSLRSTPEAS